MEIYETLGISHFESMESMSMNLDIALTMIQFWVSATFGVIVAFHFAGERLTRNLVILVSLLYAATTLTSFAAYVQSGSSMIFWAETGELFAISKGLMTQAQFETNVMFRTGSVLGGAILILAGSIAAIYYGIHVRRTATAQPTDGRPAGTRARAGKRSIKRPRRRAIRPA